MKPTFASQSHWAHANCALRLALFASCVALAALAAVPVAAQSADRWEVRIFSPRMGCSIIVWPGASGGWQYGNWPKKVDPSWTGIFIAAYREQGPDWDGPTGLFSAVSGTPIPWGGSKTWGNFYLWAQNYTPSPTDTIRIWSPTEPPLPPPFLPPAGYMGHLVLDEVPASLGYAGPVDFWIDLTVKNALSLPIPVVTDPLTDAVTKFHITVYAIPEPCSLAMLGTGLIPLAFAARRRRRRSVT